MGILDIFLKPNALSKTGKTNAYDEEYSTEVFDKVFGSENISGNTSYLPNGVDVRVNKDHIDITYDGLLAKSGAKDVYVVVGHGCNTNWTNVKTYPMDETVNHSFKLSLASPDVNDLNLAFKDPIGNWDNNSGQNYTYTNLQSKGSH